MTLICDEYIKETIKTNNYKKIIIILPPIGEEHIIDKINNKMEGNFKINY